MSTNFPINTPPTPVPPVPITPENKSPTTTLQQDITLVAQRRINLIWEATQAIISITIVVANVIAAFKLNEKNEILSNALFLIVGFYFSRTNHTKTGGIETGYGGRCILIGLFIYLVLIL